MLRRRWGEEEETMCQWRYSRIGSNLFKEAQVLRGNQYSRRYRWTFLCFRSRWRCRNYYSYLRESRSMGSLQWIGNRNDHNKVWKVRLKLLCIFSNAQTVVISRCFTSLRLVKEQFNDSQTNGYFCRNSQELRTCEQLSGSHYQDDRSRHTSDDKCLRYQVLFNAVILQSVLARHRYKR